MNCTIQGKTVLVTGANRGIGEALVKELIVQGAAHIYAAGRSLDNLAAVVGFAPEQIESVKLDVTSASDISKVAQQLDHVDILINNAGIASGVPFSDDKSVVIASAEMATHYFGSLQLTHALLPLLYRSKGAAIVNISSIAGISSFPTMGSYSASKAALHSFTQGLRADLRKANIFVQGVYPGPTATRLSDGFAGDKALPSDVAKVILVSLENGVEDVFPDAFSQAMHQIFRQNPKELERQFGQMAG